MMPSAQPLRHDAGLMAAIACYCVCACCRQADACTACGAALIRSPLTWEVLPVVAFELEPGISEEEAWGLIGEQAAAQQPAGDGDGLSGR